MRKTLTSAAIALALGAGAVQAAPIALPAGSPVFIQFNNLEQVGPANNIVVPGGSIDVNGDGILDTPATEGNWGVFNVSTLQLGSVSVPNDIIGGGPAFFADDGPTEGLFNQGQITGIFYGITIDLASGGTKATGGWIDLYWEDPATDDVLATDIAGTTFGPGARTAANAAGKFTDGTLLARLAFMPGIIDGDATTTLVSDTDVTAGVKGQANFYADVIDINNDGVIDASDGAWAFQLDGDYFHVDINGNGTAGEVGETRDFRFRTNFEALPAWGDPLSGILGLISTDPAMAFTVPEPGMVSLLGLGLFGAGLNLRRRNRG